MPSTRQTLSRNVGWSEPEKLPTPIYLAQGSQVFLNWAEVSNMILTIFSWDIIQDILRLAAAIETLGSIQGISYGEFSA